MARLTTGIIGDNIIKVESEGSIIPSGSDDLALSPIQIMEVIKEVIVEVPAVCNCEPKQIEIIKEIPKIEVIEKIVEVPVVEKQIEYVTVREFEKVEVPVEVIIEKEVKVHDITQVLEEKKKVESLERKLSQHRIAIAVLIVISIIMAVI